MVVGTPGKVKLVSMEGEVFEVDVEVALMSELLEGMLGGTEHT